MLATAKCDIIYKNVRSLLGGERVKYIVCNSETAVLNRMYDEFEKNLEDGAVISLPEHIINTQFTNRMIDDCKMGKYRYKHVIILGQREFADIDIEENFGLYRFARRELLKKLDIEPMKFHALRHTYATRLFEAGVAPKTVQHLMGHADIQTTMNIYTHVMKC